MDRRGTTARVPATVKVFPIQGSVAAKADTYWIQATQPSEAAVNMIHSHVDYQPSGDGWKGNPDLPTSGELLREQRYIRDLPVNPVDRPWSSKDAYLNAQYDILRCEGIEGLRYSVSCFRQQPNMRDDQNTCVYVSVSPDPDPVSSPLSL